MYFSPNDIASLVPPCYADFRPLILDGIGFFLDTLPARRVEAIGARLAALPNGATPAERALELMRECPSLHKLGQVMARNPNLDPDFRLLLQQLESFAARQGMDAVADRLRTELGESIARYRIELDPTPLAEASVAVVVGCRWRTPSGRGPARDAVLKVLKPGIEERLREELAVLARMSDYLDARRGAYALSGLRYRETFEAVRAQLLFELQLDREQKNLRAARRALGGVRGAFVPKVLPFSTPRVTAMERVHGHHPGLAACPGSARGRSEALVDATIAGVLVSPEAQAIFHADPHAGNLMAMEDGRIALIDWALAGRLHRGQREAMVRAVLGAVRFDAARIAAALGDLALHPPAPGVLEGPVAAALRQVRKGRVPGPSWLMELVDAAVFQGVVFPPELILFRKAIFTLDGVIRDLDPGVSVDRLFALAIVKRIAREVPRRLRGVSSIAIPAALGDFAGLYAATPKSALNFWGQTIRDLLPAKRAKSPASVVREATL